VTPTPGRFRIISAALIGLLVAGCASAQRQQGLRVWVTQTQPDAYGYFSPAECFKAAQTIVQGAACAQMIVTTTDSPTDSRWMTRYRSPQGGAMLHLARRRDRCVTMLSVMHMRGADTVGEACSLVRVTAVEE
jgi:hypothetical protein